MADDMTKVLERLNRRIGREAARHEKLERTLYEKRDVVGRERAFGEANVLRMAQSFVREELRKAKGKK